MFPTADQVSRAIIAAFDAVGMLEDLKKNQKLVQYNPKSGLSPRGDRIRYARSYAALGLHAAFPDCPFPAIGRMVGFDQPVRSMSALVAFRRRDMLKWFKPEVEGQIVEAIRLEPATSSDGDAESRRILESSAEKEAKPFAQGVETEKDADSTPNVIQRQAQGLGAGAAPRPSETCIPAFLPDRKKRMKLEDQLRQAVLNTGGRLVK